MNCRNSGGHAHDPKVQILSLFKRHGAGRDTYPIAKPNEIPLKCGVTVFQYKLEVLRMAQKRPCTTLPFGIWMALAKAKPIKRQIWLKRKLLAKLSCQMQKHTFLPVDDVTILNWLACRDLLVGDVIL